jgi:hypothetical protein
MQGTMARRNEARTTEYPLITMTKLGEVRREHFRPVFERNGLEVNGETFPYARGTLILAAGRPKDGGGIYLHDAGSLRRVWCTSDGNGYDRRCSTSDASLSPDGCHLAFFARDSDNVRARYRFRPSLKVLSLCK